MTWPGGIQEAIERHQGARYYRCALQVNPHGNAENYRGQASALTEGEYNRALVEKCGELGIEVIAVTNHNHVLGVDGIRRAATGTGLTVLPGFEIMSSEGVHVLCILGEDTSPATLERYLGDLGIHDPDSSAAISNRTLSYILAQVKTWKGICIAAHATNGGGLLKTLNGEARSKAWRDPNLLAVQIPGRVEDLPNNFKQIIQNKVLTTGVITLRQRILRSP